MTTTKKTSATDVPNVVTEYLDGRPCDTRHLQEAIDAQAAEPADAPLSDTARLYLDHGMLRVDAS